MSKIDAAKKILEDKKICTQFDSLERACVRTHIIFIIHQYVPLVFQNSTALFFTRLIIYDDCSRHRLKVVNTVYVVCSRYIRRRKESEEKTSETLGKE